MARRVWHRVDLEKPGHRHAPSWFPRVATSGNAGRQQALDFRVFLFLAGGDDVSDTTTCRGLGRNYGECAMQCATRPAFDFQRRVRPRLDVQFGDVRPGAVAPS